MRVNIGCGEFPAAGWLNIDLTHPSADVRHDVTAGLPELDGPVERLYAGHVLEHLDYGDLPRVLAAWRTHPAVSSDTVLAVAGPDCDAADRLLAQGAILAQTHREIRHGGGRWVGDVHLWRSTEGGTAQALTAAGWAVTSTTDWQLRADDWPVVACVDWQFALLATPAR